MRRIGLLLVLWAAMAMATGAASAQTDRTSLQVLVEQQEALRAQLTEGIDGVTPRQARLINKAQGEFFAIVKGKQALDELGIEDKIRVENALETINAQIVNTTAGRSDQNVCWREQTTGSKTKTTRCGTQREIDEAREGARGYLERPKVCVPPGCGS